MTPEQIKLVQSSFERMRPALPALASVFYEDLFLRDPALREMFPADMTAQKVRFTDKLTEIVQAIHRLDDLLDHTHALGARHVGYGVRADDYKTVGAALFEAVAAALGDGFDEPTREAWTIAYNLVAETMLEGAASVRLIDS